MITNVTTLPPAAPVTGASSPTDAQPAPAQTFAPAAASATQAKATPASTPDPLELSVERGQNGIYVYSLKDPSTGRLVAVIPQSHADTAPTDGSDYQAGGYVQLKA